MTCRARLAFGSCVALGLLAGNVFAHNATGGDAGGHGTVFVAIAGPEREAEGLVRTLDELVARLGLVVRVTRTETLPWPSMAAPATDASERGRVWIDARSRDSVSIDICAPHAASAASCEHRSLDRAGSSAVIVEEVAHVVYSTLESELLVQPPRPPSSPLIPPEPLVPAPSAPVAVPTSSTPPSTPPPPTREHRRRATLALDAAAFLNGRMLASGSRVDLGGGGALVVSAPTFLRPSLWFSVAVQTPFDASGPGLDLQTSVTSFRAIPAIELLHYPFLQLDLGAGGGADLFHDTPINPRLPFTGAPPSPTTHVSAVFTGQMLARLRLGPSARMVAGIDIDWSPDQHRYEVLGPSGTPTVALQPRSVRPGALLGLCIPLAGPGACGGGL